MPDVFEFLHTIFPLDRNDSIRSLISKDEENEGERSKENETVRMRFDVQRMGEVLVVVVVVWINVPLFSSPNNFSIVEVRDYFYQPWPVH